MDPAENKWTDWYRHVRASWITAQQTYIFPTALKWTLIFFFKVHKFKITNDVAKHPLYCHPDRAHRFVPWKLVYLLLAQPLYMELQDAWSKWVSWVPIHTKYFSFQIHRVCCIWFKIPDITNMALSCRFPSTGPYKWAIRLLGAAINWNFTACTRLWPL